MGNNHPNLIKILATLNEIGARINRAGLGRNLPKTLQLIVEGAVHAAAIGPDSTPTQPRASAVIWVYDEAQQEFDPGSRVSAGEPAGASADDFPRPDGLGRQAIRYRRRLLSYENKQASIHPAKQAAGAHSLVCYPLIVSDEIVGMLYVYHCDERTFTEIELLLLDNFVNLAAMAIYHGRQIGGMKQTLSRKVSELEKLNWASRLISSRTNLDETLQEILSIGLDLTAAQYGTFESYDKRKKLLIPKALAGRKENVDELPSLPIDEPSVTGWVASRRQSLLISDLRDPQWQNIYKPLPADRKMRSELAVPLIDAGGGLAGVLNIESPTPNAFTQDDQRLLEALATQAVIALQEIRLLDALQEIIEALFTDGTEELFQLIIDRACDLIDVPVGSIWTISDRETLVLHQSTASERVEAELPLDRSFTSQAIRLGQIITIDNVQTHPNFLQKELAAQQGWVSAIVAPLLIPPEKGRALGSFSLYADRLRDFSDWDKKLLTCLARHAAVAIHNAEQLARLRQIPDLSEREREVLILLTAGWTNKQIATELDITVNTVKKHVQSIFTKLNVETRAGAVAQALGR